MPEHSADRDMQGDPKFVEAEGLRANRNVVFDLVEHLRKAFEEFCNTYHEDVPFIDAFMGCHNFHKLIIGDLIRRTKMDERTAAAFRAMATATWEQAMRAGRF